jgi:hypothetical protein
MECGCDVGTQVNLRTLDVTHNVIASMAGTESLTSLEDLWAGSNGVCNATDIASLSGLASLRTVYLEHNPLARMTGYRSTVKTALPQITQLDAVRCE